MINWLHTFNPQPVLLTLGPIHIYWYGLLVVLGIIAGLLEKNKVGKGHTHNTIGALGGLAGVPFVSDMMCGYYEGAKSVDKNVKLVWNDATGFTDPSQGKSFADSQISKA